MNSMLKKCVISGGLLLAQLSILSAVDIQAGPFELQTELPFAEVEEEVSSNGQMSATGIKVVIVDRGISMSPRQVAREIGEHPICYAIKNYKPVELVMEMADKKGRMQKERKVVVVEPYMYGYDGKGNLLLQGVVRKEYTEDIDGDEVMGLNHHQKPSSQLSMSYKAKGKWETINVDHLVEARVLKTGSFVPQNGLDQKNKIVRDICRNKI